MIRTYNLKSIHELQANPVSKAEAFEGYPLSFDYGLPQGWLNGFADWCSKHQFDWIQDVTYDVIRSTTCWSYKAERHSIGRPVTCCIEVARAYLQFETQHLGIKDVIYMLVNFAGWTLVVQDVVGIGEQVHLQSPDHPELNLPLDAKDKELCQHVADLVANHNGTLTIDTPAN